MWSWIEQLKEPIISTDDVDMLAKNCTESQDALYLLRKVDTIYVSLFFNCQVYFVNLCQTIYLWPLGKRIATFISLKIKMKIVLILKCEL